MGSWTRSRFYVNATEEPWTKHYKMYSYIVDELTSIAATIVPNFSGEESIMGHSMGGHGALVIGLKMLRDSKRFLLFRQS